ncbi:MAG: hypothetical protein IKP96_02600 [Elusimicrobiaceae bacterium]|nr:hypothetical protein [Elusimicrobiaceae bacterium]
MENGRLKALLKLLTTETGSHGALLRREIAAALKADPASVQTALKEEFSDKAPIGVLHALEEIYWEELTHALARFSAKINPDLEEGLMLLSKFTNPTVSRQKITTLLDEIAHTPRTALLNATGYDEIAQVLGRYFFETLKFQPLQVHLDINDISFVQFLQKRRGSGLCVACLYTLIGARYGLDINLIDLAGRILVHLQDPQQTEALFIDPLDNGKILTQEDCRRYLDSRQLAWNDDFTSPLSSRQIVRRFIANMIYVLNKVHDERRLAYLRKYLEIVKN